MGEKSFEYGADVAWTGSLGTGTSAYTAYSRDHEITAAGRPPILASADPAFRGDPRRYSPEELLVGALSGCHMLWYLHLCADAGVVVVEYEDHASGWMVVTDRGDGRFREVVLRPTVVLQAGVDTALAERLHRDAHQYCFLASSVNFPVRCEPSVSVRPTSKDLQPVP